MNVVGAGETVEETGIDMKSILEYYSNHREIGVNSALIILIALCSKIENGMDETEAVSVFKKSVQSRGDLQFERLVLGVTEHIEKEKKMKCTKMEYSRRGEQMLRIIRLTYQGTS